MTEWNLTAEAMDKLLAVLGPGREEAGERYERIRKALLIFFQARACSYPEALADETINRVTRRIEKGGEITAADPQKFFLGVARNVFREQWGDRRWSPMDIESLPPSQQPQSNPVGLLHAESEVTRKESRLNCMDTCLESLFPGKRELIVDYYSEDRRTKIDARAELANRLGISGGALRIRMCRMRHKLEQCVEQCVGNLG